MCALLRNLFRRLLFARNFEADVEVKTDLEAGLKLVWGLVWGLENCLAQRLENSALGNVKVLLVVAPFWVDVISVLKDFRPPVTDVSVLRPGPSSLSFMSCRLLAAEAIRAYGVAPE